MISKRSLAAAILVLSTLVGMFAVPADAQKKDRSAGRLLLGKVLDAQDNPLPDAIVYLTNTRTRTVKTYIVGPDGTYRFPALSNAIDFEVYAQYKGHKSDTKSVSQFDDRSQVYVDLKVDTR
jgi:Carboxypeptidase regulatory-like domain